MSERAPRELWQCPWGICGQIAAQTCRADKRLGKFNYPHGCGSMFPKGTTFEQAKGMIGPETKQPKDPK